MARCATVLADEGSSVAGGRYTTPAMRAVLVCLLVAALAAEEAAPPGLTVMTWNCFAEPRRPADRSAAIVDHLVAQDPDIAVLQEVAPWLRGRLLTEPRLRGWRSTVIDGRSEAPGGLFVLSRFPIATSRILVLPSRLDRCALLTEIAVGGRTLRVVNVHLDSLPGHADVRALQLRALRAELLAGDDVLLAGDVNFPDGAAEEAELPPEFTDLWRALRPHEPGLTWDPARNPMASGDAGRIDRLLLRSRAWRGIAIDLTADRPVALREPELFPSDHFAVVARLVPR